MESLKKGLSPATVLPKIVALQKSPDTVTAEEAKYLVGKLTEEGQRQLDEAARAMRDDPVGTYELAHRVASGCRGTPVATKAARLQNELRNDKAVLAELRARPALESIKTLDTVLTKKVGRNVDPQSAEFQLAFAVPLKQMRATLQKMKKTWPEARATEEAAGIGEKYGIVAK